jgi:hypothetical protein
MIKKLWVIIIPLIILIFGCKVNREVLQYEEVIPILISPENGSIVSENPPTFTWETVYENIYYEIILIPGDNSESYYLREVNSEYGAATISYTFDSVLPSGVYTWQVRSRWGVNS